jgi:hypothetical protein
MKDTGTTFERLASRDEFNASVRHIKGTIAILDRFEAGENLADLINELLAEKTMIQDEVPMVVSMVIGQKHPYVSVSANIHSAISDPALLSEAVKGWHAADLVLVYQHPDLGILVLNPKNSEQMAGLDRFSKNECVTVYAGTFGKPARPSLMLKAAKDFIELVEGSSKKADPSLKKGACVYKPKKKKAAQAAQAPAARRAAPGKKAVFSAASSMQVSAADVMASHARGSAMSPAAQAQAAPAPAPIVVAPSGAIKMTPMYAVLVTNELFHNGNVEAWKRIIASYNSKHPSLQVYVYYDGERITNLNSLFTWGNVKRGTCIEFKVVGDEIVDVAKLQRYLKQGASHMFEAFLKFPVNTIPQLF